MSVRLLRRAQVPLHSAIIQHNLGKISGPLLERIDIHVEVPAVSLKELRGNTMPASNGPAPCNTRAVITTPAYLPA